MIDKNLLSAPARKLLAICLLIAAGALMSFISWQKWSDLILSFEFQIYVPWQLAQGKILYKDIAYLWGPLSPHLHALIFKIMGPGLIYLSIFNIITTGVLTVLIYKIFNNACNEQTAFFCGLTFLTAFAFSQYLLGSNFNFINPYNYDLTHGILLSFFALHQFTAYLKNPGTRTLVLTGGLSGLVFLTKAEVFAAEFTAVLTGLALFYYLSKPQDRAINSIWFLLSFAAPSLFYAFYLTLHFSPGDAVKIIFSPWLYILKGDPLGLMPFYRWMMGVDAVLANIQSMALYALAIILILASVFLLNHWYREPSRKTKFITTTMMLSFPILTAAYYQDIPWFQFPRALPLIMIGFGAYLIFKLIREPGTPETRGKIISDLVFTLFALLLMLKIFLNVRIFHYGFALAMPAALVLVRIVTYELPCWASRLSGSCEVFNVATRTMLILFLSVHVWISAGFYSLRVFSVAEGKDTFFDFPTDISEHSGVIKASLEYINANIGASESFAAIPAGVVLNYLSRRDNPLKYTYYAPMWWKLFGEEPILNDLKKSRLPYILLFDLDWDGLRFGRDYGQSAYSWIAENYEQQIMFGAVPQKEGGFGVHILKRRPAPEDTGSEPAPDPSP